MGSETPVPEAREKHSLVPRVEQTSRNERLANRDTLLLATRHAAYGCIAYERVPHMPQAEHGGDNVRYHLVELLARVIVDAVVRCASLRRERERLADQIGRAHV